MKDVETILAEIGKGKGTKTTPKGKNFGYQILGFGSGGVACTDFICASGGTILEDGSFRIHVFTGPGTFCVARAEISCNAFVDYMVVAGGGGGGTHKAGGGGAGGFRESHNACYSGPYTASPLASPSSIPVTVQGYPITVGAGSPAADRGPRGTPSTALGITSTGGGNGGTSTNHSPEGPGGSGGGAGGAGPKGTGNSPSVSPPQGQPGGNGFPGGHNGAGGGGGGATDAGDNAGSPSGGPGGTGAGTQITTSTCYGAPGPDATLRYYAGGGAGSTDPRGGGSVGNPGIGGGGAARGGAGAVNTGGGGAGGENPPTGNGGSGIVIIRYQFKKL